MYSILCEESPQSHVSIITRTDLLPDQLWIVLMKSLNFVYACQEVDINDVVRLAREREEEKAFFLISSDRSSLSYHQRSTLVVLIRKILNPTQLECCVNLRQNDLQCTI